MSPHNRRPPTRPHRVRDADRRDPYTHIYYSVFSRIIQHPLPLDGFGHDVLTSHIYENCRRQNLPQNYGAPCRTPRFFAKLKIEPPNFFRQCFFFNNNFCTPDYFVETRNVGHHRERNDRSHLTSHSNTAVCCNIERGFPYTDT